MRGTSSLWKNLTIDPTGSETGVSGANVMWRLTPGMIRACPGTGAGPPTRSIVAWNICSPTGFGGGPPCFGDFSLIPSRCSHATSRLRRRKDRADPVNTETTSLFDLRRGRTKKARAGAFGPGGRRRCRESPGVRPCRSCRGRPVRLVNEVSGPLHSQAFIGAAGARILLLDVEAEADDLSRLPRRLLHVPVQRPIDAPLPESRID